jgi:hypothetical protein
MWVVATHTPPMRQPVRVVRERAAEMRAAIAALLEGLRPGEVKRLHSKATKIVAHRPARHAAQPRAPRVQRPREWKPKDITAAQEVLEMMRTGVGVRTAPFAVPEGAWPHKLFTSEIALRLRKSMFSERAETAATALLVASVAARVVAAATELRATNPALFAAAELRTQTYRDDSGWDKTRTRGSGVVFNEAGRRLFEVAADTMARRMAEEVASVAPLGCEGSEDVGDTRTPAAPAPEEATD